MKKITKTLICVLSVLLAAIIGTSISAFAEEPAKESLAFNLSIAEETDQYVIVNIKLESGSFKNLDFGFKTNPKAIASCDYIIDGSDVAAYSNELKKSGENSVSAYNTETCQGCIAMTKDFAQKDGVIVEAKLMKVSADKVSSDDISVSITNWGATTEYDGVVVNNNLPKAEKVDETEDKKSDTTEDDKKPDDSKVDDKKTDDTKVEDDKSTEDQKTSEDNKPSDDKTESKDSDTEKSDSEKTDKGTTDITDKSDEEKKDSKKTDTDVKDTEKVDDNKSVIADNGVINGNGYINTENDNPNTGNTAIAVIVACSLLAAGCGTFILLKKRNH